MFLIGGNIMLLVFGGGVLVRGFSMSEVFSQIEFFSNSMLMIDSSLFLVNFFYVCSDLIQLLGIVLLFGIGLGMVFLIEGLSNNFIIFFDNQVGGSVIFVDL